MSRFKRKLKIYGGVSVVSIGVLQYFFGSSDNFYEYHFITDKDPDDLADFYGSEDFMELFCVFPLMGQIMMRGGTFDDEGNVHSAGLPGELVVSMVFSDEASEEGDEDPDGFQWFNKRERFEDKLFGITMWDMIQNFGFHQMPDGRCVVYHYGEYFHGYCPPLSLLVRLIFQVHARWVAWATHHHIAHEAFISKTEEEEAVEHESRTNMVFHLLKNYVWRDTKAMLGFGKARSSTTTEDETSFLVAEQPQIEREDYKKKQKKILDMVAVDIAVDKAFGAQAAAVQKTLAVKTAATTPETVIEAPEPATDVAPAPSKNETLKPTMTRDDKPMLSYEQATQVALENRSLRRTRSRLEGTSSKRIARTGSESRMQRAESRTQIRMQRTESRIQKVNSKVEKQESKKESGELQRVVSSKVDKQGSKKEELQKVVSAKVEKQESKKESGESKAAE